MCKSMHLLGIILKGNGALFSFFSLFLSFELECEWDGWSWSSHFGLWRGRYLLRIVEPPDWRSMGSNDHVATVPALDSWEINFYCAPATFTLVFRFRIWYLKVGCCTSHHLKCGTGLVELTGQETARVAAKQLMKLSSTVAGGMEHMLRPWQ